MAPHDMLDGVDVCDSQDDHGPCIDLLFDSSDDPMFEGVVPFVGGGLAWCWLPYHPLLLRFLTIWGPGVTKGRHRKGIRRPFL